MSRVGKKPITIPEKTKLTYTDRVLIVEGGKGRLAREIHPEVELKIEGGEVKVITPKADRQGFALQGLTRSLVSNMITGVNQGFERVLEINGIGYRAELSGKQIVFHIGYSHPINFDLPEGVAAAVERNNVIKLSCINKETLGQTAAAIRRLRPPEPYKGKGIKYAEETIRKKAGKTGTK
ncbi:MAG TPA: 50S ribosomal protein L6 [Deltaproteobacteria bacterium]|nr:50S ribosomal protein L6 [Deltaproteobacteria bacterium]